MRRIGKGSIRYLRWVSQFSFLIFFVFLVGNLVCSVFLPGGLNISCPVGVLQLTLSSGMLFLAIIVPGLVFLIMTFFLGRAFCSWACPLGTLIDVADVGFNKVRKGDVPKSNGLVRNVVNKYAVLAATLFGAFALRFPMFCVFCPIGIVCRGSLAGVEMYIIPLAATGLSLWGDRFWCRYLCPVGALLDGVSAFSPFIKPVVNEEKCIFKDGCPEDCEDFHKDLCATCRLIDDKKCERKCQYDVDLVNAGSTARCTRCLDCYKACDYGAVRISWGGRIFQPMTRLYSRVRKRPHKS